MRFVMEQKRFQDILPCLSILFMRFYNPVRRNPNTVTLSILFMRFPTITDYQLKDDKRLSILFMRFFIWSYLFHAVYAEVFQFSLWDSAQVQDISRWQCTSFNSLYEIRDDGGGEFRHLAYYYFQFSLWDSPRHPRRRRRVPFSTFNSLYEIPDPLFLFFVLNKLFYSPF